MNRDEFTNSEQFLDVGNGHQLYIQDWGNEKAKLPIIFLHGGPGAGTHQGNKLFFDAHQQRVIFYDQRGAGKSLPLGSLDHNTTDELVDDIEKIADHFKLDQFVITGGSWGSCLALAYGLKHPSRVKAMVLRGIFTGSQDEINFIDKGGFKNFFPDVWEKYLERTPKSHHNNPSAYHSKQIKGSDREAAKASAYAYSELEGSLLSLDDRHFAESYEEFDPAGPAIEMHYLDNLCFMPDKYILNNAGNLKMPIWLVQGRYDMVCPPITAYELHKRLPNSQLIWSQAGHKGSDRNIYEIIRSLLLQITS